MIHSQLSRELAAALPREVLDALGLLPGDAVTFEIEGDAVRMARPAAGDDVDLGLSTDQLRSLIREGLTGPTYGIQDIRAGLDERQRQRSRGF